MTEPPVSRADHQGVRAAPVTITSGRRTERRGAPAGPDGRRRLSRRGCRFLGIATTRTTWQGRIYSGAGHVHSNAKKQPDPLVFEAALEALAGELDEPATPLINNQQRRQALETWSIDETAWSDLVSRLPPVPGPQQPELGDRKRQIASIYVWVQLASGEHHFTPRPIEAAQPRPIQQAWKLRRKTIWHLLQSDRPHYTSLKAELHALAASLAKTVDRTQ